MSSYKGTTFTLNTGAKVPAVGIGTFQDVDAQEGAVLEALKVGYRHIDTARAYGTEPAIANAIKKSGVPREEIFITTKLWNTAHHPDDVEKACDASLKDLQTEYIDLYLMHWPCAFARSEEKTPMDTDGTIKVADYDYVDTYKAMERLVAAGKVRAIGVSNFSKAELERVLAEANIVPAAHQLESHPYLAQFSFADFHKKHNIHLTHYSPFGNANPFYHGVKGIGKLIEDPEIVEVGKKYNKSGAQVTLAWAINNGRSVIPKSKTPARIAENLAADFKLEPEDLKKLNAVDKKFRINDLSKAFKWNFYADLDGKRPELAYP